VPDPGTRPRPSRPDRIAERLPAVTADETRTADQLRDEIRAESARLDDALGAFQADVRRTARVAGSLLITVAAARLLLRLARTRT
jgi:hypothetical protein